ncbi:MAG: hypothetical protein JWP61_700, partial [Friedmanniella sp.]|nr:hypothetical protein [Friedmanniella sp.]
MSDPDPTDARDPRALTSWSPDGPAPPTFAPPAFPPPAALP